MSELGRMGPPDAGTPLGAWVLALERRRVQLSRRRAERLRIGLVFTILCVLGAVALVPIVWMISTSLKVDSQIFTNPPIWIPNPVRWRNYADALSPASGFEFWLTKLNQFTQPGDDVLVRVQKAEMVKAFIVSTEYRQRFGP